ncbi:MAG: DEAD/DEAH box helicase, partial [Bifidobacteriaceae bacterium]|nr:DEAD/DEAH box helicase [Bifidobacteriaceae bacterium]
MSSSATPPPAAAPAVAAPGAPAAGVAGWLARPLTRVVSSKAAAKALDALGLQTVEDLLRHFPRRYDQPGRFTDLGGLQVGEHVTVLARVQDSGLVPMRSRPGFRLTAIVTDATGRPLDLTFFFRQRHIADYTLRQLEPGRQGLFTGTVGVYGGRLQLTHPDKLMFGEKTDAEAAVLDATKPIPIYQASAKLPSWKIGQTIRLVLGMMPPGLPDPLPPALLADPPAGLWLPGDTAVAGPLPGLAEALTQIHAPASEADWLRARARFRLEEAFVLQAALARRRAGTPGLAAAARPGRPGGALAAFDAHLPFRLTGAQAKVGDQLAQDLAATHPMQRLLQGDVGSGKTVVALRAMLQVVDSGGQAALLVPTEVLAGQHYRSIRQLLGPLAARDLVEQAQEDFADDAGAPDGAAVTTPEGRSEKDQPSGIGHGETEVSDDIGRGADGTRPVTVTLLTGSLGTAQKREALAAARDGRADIVIGTHALLSDPVAFRGLGLVVVDEQHRFGVEQRDVLRTRGSVPPHMLVMTATPIPRSLAMTVFGDLEVSVLDELPPGRCPVQTTVVPASKPAWVARVW